MPINSNAMDGHSVTKLTTHWLGAGLSLFGPGVPNIASLAGFFQIWGLGPISHRQTLRFAIPVCIVLGPLMDWSKPNPPGRLGLD